MFWLHQGSNNTPSISQKGIESTLKRIQGVVIFEDDVLVNRNTKEQFDKRMVAAKSRPREKSFKINEKKSNSKPFNNAIFLGYYISKEEIAPDPTHVHSNRLLGW